MEKPSGADLDAVTRHLYQAIAACREEEEVLAAHLLAIIQVRARARDRYSLQDLEAPTVVETAAEAASGFWATVERGSASDYHGQIAAGTIDVGPATTTIFFPVLLPWSCCQEAKGRACARCGARGWTHGAHSLKDLRCLDCQEYISPLAADRLRR